MLTFSSTMQVTSCWVSLDLSVLVGLQREGFLLCQGFASTGQTDTIAGQRIALRTEGSDTRTKRSKNVIRAVASCITCFSPRPCT